MKSSVPARGPSEPPKTLAAPAFSVGSKLAAATVALVLLVTAGIYVGLSRYQRENLLSAKEQAAAGMVRLFADSCAAPMTFEDEKAVEASIGMLGRDRDVEYVGVWRVGEAGAIADRFGELKRGVVEVPHKPGAGVELVRKADRVVLTTPIRDPTQATIGVTTVAFSLARENAAIADVRKRTLLVSALVGLCLSLLLIGLARALIVKPLGKLVVAAKRIERGRAGEIDIDTRDEIGQLATAFRAMGEAIQNREQRINARNRDMRFVLDNVGQGFITLDTDGRMLDERSRIVDEWFGAPEGRMSFAEFLGRIDGKTASWFGVAWSAVVDDLLPLEMALEQLPRTIRKGPLTFEMTYRPVQQQDVLDKVIVVITDVTARIERERAERTQREMMSLFQRSLSDRHGLQAFLAESRALVEQVQHGDAADLALTKRAIHTLKGNSMMFGIESVAAFCHELEDRIQTSGAPPVLDDRTQLAGLWQAVEGIVTGLSLQGDRIELDAAEYAGLLQGLERRIDHRTLLASATTWQYERASDRLHSLSDQTEFVAARLGKKNVSVVCAPSSLRLPPRRWDSFWAAFSHVLRNAVDHGVESPEDRVKAGKPPSATIALKIEAEDQALVVAVEDDGRGIPWPLIAKRAEERGLPHHTRADLERALFVQGVTSTETVTTMSGRGVGLAAVQETVRKLGGRIEVWSEQGLGTKFRFVLPTPTTATAVGVGLSSSG